MAEEKETPNPRAASSTATKEEAQTYPRERILAEAEALFGVPSHVVVGALAAGTTGNKTDLSVDEVKKAIKEFGEREVEPPPEAVVESEGEEE